MSENSMLYPSWKRNNTFKLAPQDLQIELVLRLVHRRSVTGFLSLLCLFALLVLTGSPQAAQAQPPECWGHRCAPPHLLKRLLFNMSHGRGKIPAMHIEDYDYYWLKLLQRKANRCRSLLSSKPLPGTAAVGQNLAKRFLSQNTYN